MSVVHRRLSRNAGEKRQTNIRPQEVGTNTRDAVPAGKGDSISTESSAPDSLERQLDEVEALLDAQSREQEQLLQLMNQLDEQLDAVESVLTRGTDSAVGVS